MERADNAIIVFILIIMILEMVYVSLTFRTDAFNLKKNALDTFFVLTIESICNFRKYM